MSKPGKQITVCPECQDSRKSRNKSKKCLTVHVEEGNNWWHCNHCQWKGNLDHLNAKSEMYDYAKMPAQPPSLFSDEIKHWLNVRGLNTLVAQEVNVYQKDQSIAFPVFGRNGQLRNVKFKSLKDKVTFQVPRDKGSEPCFIGMNLLDFKKDQENTLIIAEGESDWMTLLQCGFKNVLCVPMGAPSENATNFQAEFDYAFDKEFREHVLPFFQTIIICGDNDPSGKLLNEELSKALEIRDRCKFLKYPEGYNDVNEVFHGSIEKKLDGQQRSGVQRLIAAAEFFPLDGIVSVQDFERKLMDDSNAPIIQTLLTGIPFFDDRIKLAAPFNYVITGCPGSGKSTVARAHDIALCKKNKDVKMALFIPEGRPLEMEFRSMMAVYHNKRWSEQSKTEREEAIFWLKSRFHVVSVGKSQFQSFDDIWNAGGDSHNTLKKILEYVKILKYQVGITGYRIDPWNKIEHQRPKHLSETEWIGKLLDKIVAFNEYFGLYSQIIAHPHKLSENKFGNYDVPSLYQINGGANWFNKADLGLIVHTDYFSESEKGEKSNFKLKHPKTFLRTMKKKHGELGAIGQSDTIYLNEGRGGVYQLTPPKLKQSEGQLEIDVNQRQVMDDISKPYKDDDDNEFDDLPF